MNEKIRLGNEWLQANGIVDVEFGKSKDSYMGTIFALFPVKSANSGRRSCIMKSPAFGELVESIRNAYGLAYDNRPLGC